MQQRQVDKRNFEQIVHIPWQLDLIIIIIISGFQFSRTSKLIFVQRDNHLL